MPFQITLSPSQHRFTAEADDRLLDAGLKQGIGLPFGCKSGVCGACKAKVLSGEVVHRDANENVLTPAERAQGMALLCCASARSPLTVEIREVEGVADYPVRVMPARIQSIELAAPDIAVLMLKLPANENFRYRPGQYIDVLLKDGLRRSFSIANANARDDGIELHIRRVNGGFFTAQVFTTLKARDILRIEGPLGGFYLRDGNAPVVLLAGGTGFAPIKGIVESAIAARKTRPMHLYWGAHDQAGLYRHELAQAWARQHSWFRYTPVLSGQRPAGWTGRTGLVHQALMADYPNLGGHQVYACGAPAMVSAAQVDLTRRCKLPEEAFFSDAFTFSMSASVPA